MPAELKAHVDAAYESEYAWSKPHHYPDEKTVEPRKTPKEKVIPPPPDFVLVSAPVKLANGAILDVHVAKHGDTEPDPRVAPAYWAIVQAEARVERWRLAGYLALAWIVPSLVLYALGWQWRGSGEDFQNRPRRDGCRAVVWKRRLVDEASASSFSDPHAVPARQRLPSMFGWSEYAAAGGLMSYGASQRDAHARLATYADKILKGAKPADLPVERPRSSSWSSI